MSRFLESFIKKINQYAGFLIVAVFCTTSFANDDIEGIDVHITRFRQEQPTSSASKYETWRFCDYLTKKNTPETLSIFTQMCASSNLSSKHFNERWMTADEQATFLAETAHEEEMNRINAIFDSGLKALQTSLKIRENQQTWRNLELSKPLFGREEGSLVTQEWSSIWDDISDQHQTLLKNKKRPNRLVQTLCTIPPHTLIMIAGVIIYGGYEEISKLLAQITIPDDDLGFCPIDKYGLVFARGTHTQSWVMPNYLLGGVYNTTADFSVRGAHTQSWVMPYFPLDAICNTTAGFIAVAPKSITACWNVVGDCLVGPCFNFPKLEHPQRPAFLNTTPINLNITPTKKMVHSEKTMLEIQRRPSQTDTTTQDDSWFGWKSISGAVGTIFFVTWSIIKG